MAYWVANGFRYYDLPGVQDRPAIAQLAGGGTFLAWVDYSGTAPVISGKSLNAAEVPQGGDVQLAGPLTAGASNTVRLVATADGGFDAFWNESTPVSKSGQQTQYVGQHFSAAGQAAGAKFAVTPDPVPGFDFYFNATALASGNILVTWGTSWRIVAPDGSPVTGVQSFNPVVNAGDGLNATYDVTAARDGGFYIAWSVNSTDGSCHTYFEKFDAGGNAIGGPHLAINYAVLNETHITELADGNVVVSAEAYERAADQDIIFAAEFTPAGHLAGFRGEQINVPVGQRSHSHEVTALPDGGFVISLTQFTPGSYDGKLFMQRYDSGFMPTQLPIGNFVGDTGSASTYSVIAHADDAPAFAWQLTGTTDAGDIHMRSFANEAGPNDRTVNGTAGTDTLSYADVRSHYSISRTADGVTVLGPDGGFTQTDWLHGIERLHFSDMNVALDVDGNAGNAYRLYQAAFNRGAEPGGLGYHIADLDKGVPIEIVAQHFIESPEFQSHYGNPDNATFVNLLYSNVLHRSGDSAGIAYHLHDLDSGVSRAAVLVHFAESPENAAALVGVIENGMAYIPA